MKFPIDKRKREILQEVPIYSDIDFSKYKDNEKLFWFQEKRVIGWLLNDTRKIKEEAKSMFGLVAMVCIGVEFLSKFRYGKDDPKVYFPLFLEEYLDYNFRKEIKNVYKPVPPPTKFEKRFYNKQKLKYSEIFFFGMRNQLMHRFLFRHSVLIEPQLRFLTWKRKKKRLLVDSRFLLIKFENGVMKYLNQIWESRPSSILYKNFFTIFSENFERTY